MSDDAASASAGRDWVGWHRAYEDPTSGLSWRLRVIRERIRQTLDGLPAGPIRAISMCAGQGHDVIGALADHPRRADVAALLVELDPHNAQVARDLASEAGLTGVEVVNGDGSSTSAYAGAVPAQLILVCGVFGNITDTDIETTVANLPRLAAPAATVIWTRHRRPPDLTGQIRTWFARANFEEVAFDAFPAGVQSVGVHRLAGSPQGYEPGRELFRFLDYDSLNDPRRV